jgi:uncharacterized protein
MELKNEFEVTSPMDETWTVLTDIERIAPCMPGAELREVEGDEYRGVVKVKLGAITAEYRGVARFLEKDGASHVAILRAEGRETRGQGNASATITARLEPTDTGTRVNVETDLQITGKVAQFGRGLLADISSTLLGQFVENLESTVLHNVSVGRGLEPGAAVPDTSACYDVAGQAPLAGYESVTKSRVVPAGEGRSSDPIDAIALARGAIVRRVVPAVWSMAAFLTLVAIARRIFFSRKSER